MKFVSRWYLIRVKILITAERDKAVFEKPIGYRYRMAV